MRESKLRELPRHKGVTIIELMAVIGVIVILAAIVFPAIMNVRESSRRMTCQSNLHQIGILVSDYHAQHKHLPGRGLLRPLVEMIDPNLEKLLLAGIEPGSPFPAWNPPSIFICPSDSLSVDPNQRYSYHINGGSNLNLIEGGPKGLLPQKSLINPPFFMGAKKFSDITDGLANTALAAERLLKITSGPINVELKRNNPLRTSHGLDRDYLNGEEDIMLSDVQRLKSTGRFLPIGFAIETLGFGFFHSSEFPYNHVGPPNEWEFRGPLTSGTAPPSSLHAGGVNIVFLDGRVIFVENGTDMTVWRALGTIAGHEPQTIDK